MAASLEPRSGLGRGCGGREAGPDLQAPTHFPACCPPFTSLPDPARCFLWVLPSWSPPRLVGGGDGVEGGDRLKMPMLSRMLVSLRARPTQQADRDFLTSASLRRTPCLHPTPECGRRNWGGPSHNQKTNVGPRPSGKSPPGCEGGGRKGRAGTSQRGSWVCGEEELAATDIQTPEGHW